MNLQTTTNEYSCPRPEIAFYLDGELSPSAEMNLETHLAVCKECLSELNLHKKMSAALDFAFEEKGEIELPENFANVVATTAESSVSGLRSRKEQIRAFGLCATLFLLVIVGLGAETENLFKAVANFAEQGVTIIGFVFHLLYNIAFGICVITRTLFNSFLFTSTFSVLFFVSLFFVLFITLFRLLIRYNRSQELRAK